MTNKKYAKEVLKRENIVKIQLSTIASRELHMAMGICTEAGELLDALKKAYFYEQSVDFINVKEELGDLLFYITGMCNIYGWTLKEVMALNTEKLTVRYGEAFDKEKAANRDLEKERETLDNSDGGEGSTRRHRTTR